MKPPENMTPDELRAEILSGSVSHGTLRSADLIPAFLDALAIADPVAYSQMMTAPFGVIPAHVQDEGDSSDWYESEAADALLAELFEALDAAAPEGFYFGALEGDGSDFGYWPQEQE